MMDRRENSGRRETDNDDYSEDRKLILYRLDKIDERLDHMHASVDRLAGKVARLDKRSASLGFLAGSVPAIAALAKAFWH